MNNPYKTEDKFKIAVVILSWNGRNFLEEFLPSVVANSNIPGCMVFVADNCSSDDSVSFIESNFPTVQIIRNKTNDGFAGGYNNALKKVNADYYVLLNQDVEVTPGWINPVIDLMESDPAIAAAQPKIKAFHNREMFEYAGAAGGFIDILDYPFCRGRIFYEVEEDKGQYDDVIDIFWATGACMFIRSEVYHSLGGLDVDFFAHMEEIDLCWRIRNRGHRIVFCPDSIVYHVGGGSLPQGNPHKTYLNFRNNLIMMYKNEHVSRLIWKLPLRLCLDGIAGFYSILIERKPQDVMAIIKAHFHFYFGIHKWNAKRKLNVIPKNPVSAGRLDKSLVWQFFAKGKKHFRELTKD